MTGRAGRKCRIGAVLAVALAATIQVAVSNPPVSSASGTASTAAAASDSPVGTAASSDPVVTATVTATQDEPTPIGSGTAPRRSATIRPGPVTAPKRAPARAPIAAAASPNYLTLTAASLDALGLKYLGTFSVSRPSGNVDVLRFTLTGGAFTGLELTQVCTAGATVVTAGDSASLGSMTFDAVALSGTVGGAPLTFTVASPPAAAFPAEVVLDQLTLSATSASANTLTVPSFSTSAASC